MNLEKYREDYSEAPFELYEYAEEAEKLTDCDELKEAGKAYLKAKERLEKMLDKYDVIIG